MLFRRKCRKFCHTFDCLKKPRIVPVQKSKTPEEGVLQTPRKVWDRLGFVFLPREFWKNQRSYFQKTGAIKNAFPKVIPAEKKAFLPDMFPKTSHPDGFRSGWHLSGTFRWIPGEYPADGIHSLSDKCLSLLFLLFPFFLGRSAAAARGKSIYTPSDVTDQYPRKTIPRNALRERAFVAVFPGYTHANPPNGYAHESVNSTKPPSPP